MSKEDLRVEGSALSARQPEGREPRPMLGLIGCVSCVSCLSCVSEKILESFILFVKVKQHKGIGNVTLCVSWLSCLSCVYFFNFWVCPKSM